MTKIGIASLGIVLIAGALWFGMQKDTSQTTTESVTDKRSFSPEIEHILTERIVTLEQVTTHPDIVSAVIASNVEHSTMTDVDIVNMDTELQAASPDDAVLKELFEGSAATHLRAFQNNHPELPEIFITDRFGINVAQTNVTSDYYQADEDWWRETYNAGVGKTHFGEIEYDASAEADSIPLYVPIYQEGQLVGVLKAILSVSFVQSAL